MKVDEIPYDVTTKEVIDVDDNQQFGPHSVVLNNIFRNKSQAVKSLEPGEYINDTAIFYVMKSLDMNHPSVEFKSIDTYVHGQLLIGTKDERVEKLRKIFRNLFRDNVRKRSGQCPDILFPINPDGQHWSLLVLHVEQREIMHYCSLGCPLKSYTSTYSMMKTVSKVLDEFLEFEKGEKWQIFDNINAPRQQDGYNCGIYVCMMAKQLYFHQELLINTKLANEFRSVLQSKFKAGMSSGLLNFHEQCWGQMPSDNSKCLKFFHYH